MSERSRTISRKDFLKLGLALGLYGAMPRRSWAEQGANAMPFWGYLAHLSFNMWGDREAPELKAEYWSGQPYLRFDDGLWNDLLKKMQAEGVNLVVIDVGDGVQYESHPEIAVKNAWSRDRLREELAKMRALGLEPIPKLNFSATHDYWLGPYARKVSSDEYYAVCRDLIAEVIKLFDKPRLFHLGMDEETAEHQKEMAYAVIRQHELWWHDMLFYIEQVEKGGARPWIWSDYFWHHPELFLEKMPKSVLQSNWYYGEKFEDKIDYVKAYLELEKNGYDQAPTGSNWSVDTNFEGTVEFCAKHISPGHLKGFLQTSWKPTLEACRERHFKAIEQVGRARKWYETARKA